jgi:hypothetical protein
MLKPASDFKGLVIAAVDGDLGSVADLYFDDLSRTVRYLVVGTGTWLPGRQLLISPLSVREVADKDPGRSHPGPGQEQPAGRDRQAGQPAAGGGDRPVLRSAPLLGRAVERETALGDPSLRSARDVTGCYIVALDGDIGHVAGRSGSTGSGRGADPAVQGRTHGKSDREESTRPPPNRAGRRFPLVV